MHRSSGWIALEDRTDSSDDAVLHRPDGTTAPVRLTNYSDDGCRIQTSLQLPIGERLEIAIPKVGQIRAQIRWSLNGEAGVRFDQAGGRDD